MKTETIQITADKVRVGDITPWGTAESVDYFRETLSREMRIIIGVAEVWMSKEAKITVTRPVADPCPRGKWKFESGSVHLDNLPFSRLDFDERCAFFRRAVALLNEEEQQANYRTIAEIEARVEWK